jgi:rhodanese-related sulfurtransferase
MTDIITGEQLKEMIESGRDFDLLDVRDTPEYEKEHLPGAKSMLIADMEERAGSELDKNKTVVVYSEDINCPASTIAVQRLSIMGFKELRDYAGSFRDWKEAGFPLEK